MIIYKKGDILKDESEALVNTVNCVGVMGRGIALQFKNTFPENFHAYSIACKKEEVQPGKMFTFETKSLTNPKYIINFPTKRHWKGKSQINDIKSGLIALKEDIKKFKIESVAIPPLGSGLGGLNWNEVKNLIEIILSELPNVQINIYEPYGAPNTEKIAHTKDIPPMTTGRAVLIELINRYLSGLLDPFITLLEIHKLMYFMQELGEPLRLKYQKAPYGPYAENLRHVMNLIEGHYIIGYSDGGDSPLKPLKLIPGATQEASSFLNDYPETKSRLEKVSNLVDGFESPYGLELLSTVLWIINYENVKSKGELFKNFYSWGDRKSQFTKRQIEIAVNVAAQKGWFKENILL
jgi:O-acetyl-ADP-ribose deacetylase (regulator of RNase III)